MARPMKDGVDYFPLDVNTDTDKKFRIIEAKYGIVGFGIIVKLFQQIYRDNGYFYKWDEDTAVICAALWSSSKRPLSGDDVNEVVNEAVKRDIFNKELYGKYSILTSRGLQKRYFEAVKRRSRVDAEKAYLLLSAPEIPENVYINGVNVSGNPENVCNNSQSKVKKSKGKERESNTRARARSHSPALDEVKAYFRQEKLKPDAKKFFYFYEAKGWKGIADWRAKAKEWDAAEHSDGKEYAGYDIELYEEMINSDEYYSSDLQKEDMK